MQFKTIHFWHAQIGDHAAFVRRRREQKLAGPAKRQNFVIDKLQQHANGLANTVVIVNEIDRTASHSTKLPSAKARILARIT